jgi:superfamily II DNA or RNA helicase
MTIPIPPNTRVIHKSHPEYGFGVVRYVEEDAFGDVRLQVVFDHVDNLENVAIEQIEVVPDSLTAAAASQWGDVAAFRRKLAVGLVIAENNLTGGFTRAAVQPLPHQAYLLDKILSADRFGHILADDVGLGKTIEAGLLITCLMRREPPQRIMIVCPSGLALQWQEEMDEHFGLNFAVMGDNFDGKLAPSWRAQPLIIAPLDRLKRDEYRELLTQVGGFDLVVCDESHRLTAKRRFFTNKLEKTSNYQLFEFLVQSRLIRQVENNDKTPRSPRLLLLSATPHQGDDERFLHLLHLARPDLFRTDKKASEQFSVESLVETMTRTPKSRAVDWDGKPLFKGHQTMTLDVPWTVQEKEVSDLLTQYILKSIDFNRDSDRGTQLVIQLVMHTFHKIAASSWAALRRALEQRLKALEGKVSKLSELLETDPEGDPDDEARDFALPAKAFFDNERLLLETLLNRIDDLPTDSKYDRFSTLLRELDRAEPGCKVLVFTQYRVTQELLQEKLPQLFAGGVGETIHGGIGMQDRRASRIRFENDSRFLVSTEAGGEGLNLQRACHIMVNYDFPWNPMRLQQRIGRLDRYGQKEIVKVFNLRVPDSWDQHISTRILERLEIIQKTMNLASAGLVEDYKEMILGDIAEHIDGARFVESRSGSSVSNQQLDDWVQGALQSVERWRDLFSPELGMDTETNRLKPTLTSEHFKSAFCFGCENHGIRLRETRNSQSQFLAGVSNFELPMAFRDPIFRPSRTMHVVFDRDVYAAVRGQDLGCVRGQTIRPLLTGFGEPFADWLFQTAMQANSSEIAFSVQAPKDWKFGSGWMFVFALRWLGKRRRLATPDSLVICFVDVAGNIQEVRPVQAMTLALHAQNVQSTLALPNDAVQAAAKKLAQQVLKDCAAKRDPFAKGAAGLSLLFTAAVNA